MRETFVSEHIWLIETIMQSFLQIWESKVWGIRHLAWKRSTAKLHFHRKIHCLLQNHSFFFQFILLVSGNHFTFSNQSNAINSIQIPRRTHQRVCYQKKVRISHLVGIQLRNLESDCSLNPLAEKSNHDGWSDKQPAGIWNADAY